MEQQNKKVFQHSGTLLVVMLVGLCILGAGLTVWNYSQHVFSTQHARVINDAGEVEAFFPIALSGKIQPDQMARITKAQTAIFGKQGALTKPIAAHVVSIKTFLPTANYSQPRLLVTLHTTKNSTHHPDEKSLIPSTQCTVTIDTTLPRSQ